MNVSRKSSDVDSANKGACMTPNAVTDEPYLGPAPYLREHADRFGGRDAEADDLACLIEAHQVVLLYSQSGAGKSSLINAKLTPMLQQRDCRVMLTRPGRQAPRGVQSDADTNPFVDNLLENLQSEDHRDGNSGTSVLEEALSRGVTQPSDTGALNVVILDQFEETFTYSSPRKSKYRRELMTRLSNALASTADLRLVFSIREEYIGSLEPYAGLFDGFRTRRRLDRLTIAQSREAIQKPLLGTKYVWNEDALKLLLKELTTFKVRDSDGTIREIGEERVEPVQLSVVCRYLWNKLVRSEQTTFTAALVEESGNVDAALKEFYDNAVLSAVETSGADERKLRRFFHYRLITEFGTRGSYLRGEHETGDIPNTALDVLDCLHLTHTEQRAGAPWYELAHDRFVPAIIESNRAWLLRQLKPEHIETSRRLADRAERWNADHRDRRHLLSDRDLGEAEILVVSPSAPDLGLDREVVRAFLEASREKSSAEMLAKLRSRQFLAGIAFLSAALLLIVAVVAAGVAFRRRQQADDVARRVRGAEERLRFQDAHLQFESSFLNYAWTLLQIRRVTTEIERTGDVAVKKQLQEQNGKLERDLAQSQTDFKSNAQTWIAANEARANAERARERAWLEQLAGVVDKQAVSDRLMRAADSEDDPERAILLARYAVGVMDTRPAIASLEKALARRPLHLEGHKDQVFPVAFVPPDRVLTGGADGTVREWSRSTGAMTKLFVGHTDSVFDLAVSPDRTRIATVSADRKLMVWHLADATHRAFDLPSRGWGVAFSPDGRSIAVAIEGEKSAPGAVEIYDTVSSARTELKPLAGKMYGVTFSPDGRWFAAVGEGGLAVYEAARMSAPPRILADHKQIVYRAAFSPDSTRLITTSLDATARIYDVPSFQSLTVLNEHRTEHTAMLGMAGFSHDSNMVATASLDGSFRLWNPATGESIGRRDAGCGPAFGVAFDQTDTLLAEGCVNGAVLWSLAGERFPPNDAASGGAASIQLKDESREMLLLRSQFTVGFGRDLSDDDCRLYLGRECPARVQ